MQFRVSALAFATALCITPSLVFGTSYSGSAQGSVEAAFSPDEGAQELVIKVIDASRTEVCVLAYSFTSEPVTASLLRAIKRGVRVYMVVDHKENFVEDRSGKARAALGALVNAGAQVRVISAYPIHHDKIICVDRRHVETGSFNFSSAAAHRNSENVLVHWDSPELAQAYLQHFKRNWDQAAPLSASE